jgi:hypothetical protein
VTLKAQVPLKALKPNHQVHYPARALNRRPRTIRQPELLSWSFLKTGSLRNVITDTEFSQQRNLKSKCGRQCSMIAPEPITLSDIDDYLEDLTAIAQTANLALNLCSRARMAVSAGSQKVAYSQLAQVGSLLAKIYQAGDARE